jgi:ribosomal protein S18 acetylase RimI-like enzyme
MNIRLAVSSDLSAYTSLLQKTYQDSYTKPEIGLTPACFSEEVFNTKDTQEYLKSNLLQNDNQKCWLAFEGDELVGSITIVGKDKEYELRGFYVASIYQGQGIGKSLWKLALSFAKNKDIVLDIYAHNTKTIDLYKRWGFIIDKDKGEFFRHWDEWPKNVKAKCIYMRLEQ